MTIDQKKRNLLNGYLPLLWLAILGFLIYSQTIQYHYTYLDDHSLILGRMNLLKDFTHPEKIFMEDAFHSGDKAFYYRPLLTLSLMIDAKISNGKFAFFHFSNILYHILAAWFLFLFLIELGYKRTLSFVFSILFMVHPVLTQNVAWVPGRNDSLLAIFVLLSFIYFVRYIQTESLKFQAFHLLFFILALFTKESAIALPLLAVGWLMMTKKFKWHILLINGFVWIGIIFIWLVIRYKALHGSSGFGLNDSMISMFQNLYALIPYLGKIFIPVKLGILPVTKDLTFHFVTGLMALLFLIFAIFRTKEKRFFYFAFGISWFLLFLLPALIQGLQKPAEFSEHRLYLPLVGIFIFLAETDLIKKTKKIIIPVGILLTFSILSFLHADHFRNQLDFWKFAVKSSPSSAFNNNNLGAMYYLKNDFPLAEKYFRMAIALNPVEPMANGNLGLVLMNTNHPQEAEQSYLKEIKVNPLYDNVCFNLGVLYYRSGFIKEALPLFEQTIRINPYYTDAYRYLVQYYLNQKDTIMASKWAQQAQVRKLNLYE